MIRTPRILNRLFALLAFLAVATFLYACGGGSTGSANIVKNNITLAMNPNVTSAVYGKEFTFSDGVPELGTSSLTKITFSQNPSNSVQPNFSIASSEGTATGFMTYGSCIFNITGATGAWASKIGQTLKVHPCEIEIGSSGAKVNIEQDYVNVVFKLGNKNAFGITAVITVRTDGTVEFITSLGIVTVSPITTTTVPGNTTTTVLGVTTSTNNGFSTSVSGGGNIIASDGGTTTGITTSNLTATAASTVGSTPVNTTTVPLCTFVSGATGGTGAAGSYTGTGCINPVTAQLQ